MKQSNVVKRVVVLSFAFLTATSTVWAENAPSLNEAMATASHISRAFAAKMQKKAETAKLENASSPKAPTLRSSLLGHTLVFKQQLVIGEKYEGAEIVSYAIDSDFYFECALDKKDEGENLTIPVGAEAKITDVYNTARYAHGVTIIALDHPQLSRIECSLTFFGSTETILNPIDLNSSLEDNERARLELKELKKFFEIK